MGLVLDTGGLIAFDRGNREVAALIEAIRRRREQVITSSGCVAQAWRGDGSRQALLARLLHGVDECALGPHVSRALGELCGRAAMSDVIDAHVTVLARDGDLVLTSDPADVRALLRAAGTRARIVSC
jgi:hypothetical protein